VCSFSRRSSSSLAACQSARLTTLWSVMSFSFAGPPVLFWRLPI
jgi:hypothetical protein